MVALSNIAKLKRQSALGLISKAGCLQTYSVQGLASLLVISCKAVAQTNYLDLILQAHGGNAGIFPFNVNKWMVVIPGALGGICFVIGTLLAWVVTHRSISLMRADPSKPTSLCAILYLFVSPRISGVCLFVACDCLHGCELKGGLVGPLYSRNPMLEVEKWTVPVSTYACGVLILPCPAAAKYCSTEA